MREHATLAMLSQDGACATIAMFHMVEYVILALLSVTRWNVLPWPRCPLEEYVTLAMFHMTDLLS
jgi:hypothetical protein